jgi:hypothetical protein
MRGMGIGNLRGKWRLTGWHRGKNPSKERIFSSCTLQKGFERFSNVPCKPLKGFEKRLYLHAGLRERLEKFFRQQF